MFHYVVNRSDVTTHLLFFLHLSHYLLVCNLGTKFTDRSSGRHGEDKHSLQRVCLLIYILQGGGHRRYMPLNLQIHLDVF